MKGIETAVDFFFCGVTAFSTLDIFCYLSLLMSLWNMENKIKQQKAGFKLDIGCLSLVMALIHVEF